MNTSIAALYFNMDVNYFSSQERNFTNTKMYIYSGSGYYVYYETSGAIGSVVLASKKYKAEDRCFSFQYHMYGDKMGTLKVLYEYI